MDFFPTASRWQTVSESSPSESELDTTACGMSAKGFLDDTSSPISPALLGLVGGGSFNFTRAFDNVDRAEPSPHSACSFSRSRPAEISTCLHPLNKLSYLRSPRPPVNFLARVNSKIRPLSLDESSFAKFRVMDTFLFPLDVG